MYDVSCGKGRRGCCIIIPDTGVGPVGNVVFVYGPLPGGSSGWQAIFIPHPEVADRDSETDR